MIHLDAVNGRYNREFQVVNNRKARDLTYGKLPACLVIEKNPHENEEEKSIAVLRCGWIDILSY